MTQLEKGENRPKPEQDAKGRFLPGNRGNGGRSRGSRNLLADAMIADLYEDWQEHGIRAIRECRETRPADYLKIVAMIVSKCDISTEDDMRDAAVEQFIEERRQQALKMIAKMDEPQ
jgi:hypothetical protein